MAVAIKYQHAIMLDFALLPSRLNSSNNTPSPGRNRPESGPRGQMVEIIAMPDMCPIQYLRDNLSSGASGETVLAHPRLPPLADS